MRLLLIHHKLRGSNRGRGAAQFGDNSIGELVLDRKGLAMTAILIVKRLKGQPEGERLQLTMSEPIFVDRYEYDKPMTSLAIEEIGPAPKERATKAKLDPEAGEVVSVAAGLKAKTQPAMTSTERSRLRRERLKAEKAATGSLAPASAFGLRTYRLAFASLRAFGLRAVPVFDQGILQMTLYNRVHKYPVSRREKIENYVADKVEVFTGDVRRNAFGYKDRDGRKLIASVLADFGFDRLTGPNNRMFWRRRDRRPGTEMDPAR